jgi:hypothetical protein
LAFLRKQTRYDLIACTTWHRRNSSSSCARFNDIDRSRLDLFGLCDATSTDKAGFAAGSSSEPRGRTNCVHLAIVVASGVCPALRVCCRTPCSRVHESTQSCPELCCCQDLPELPADSRGEANSKPPAPNHVAPPRPARGSNGANRADRKPGRTSQPCQPRRRAFPGWPRRGTSSVKRSSRPWLALGMRAIPANGPLQ